MLALVSRGILLILAIATAVILRRRHTTILEIDIEKGQTTNESSGKTPGRVSSPTQATWPFPGSLALQDKPKHGSCLPNESVQPDLPSSKSTRTHNTDEYGYKMSRQDFIFLPLILSIAQVFAILSAALDVAASILANSARTDQPQLHILLASAACTVLWSFMVLATVQSKSNSSSIMSSSPSCGQYFPPHLDRIPRRSKLR